MITSSDLADQDQRSLFLPSSAPIIVTNSDAMDSEILTHIKMDLESTSVTQKVSLTFARMCVSVFMVQKNRQMTGLSCLIHRHHNKQT